MSSRAAARRRSAWAASRSTSFQVEALDLGVGFGEVSVRDLHVGDGDHRVP
jgi:hypothetical protein